MRPGNQIEKTDGEAVGGEHMEKNPYRKQGEEENSETRRRGRGGDHREA